MKTKTNKSTVTFRANDARITGSDNAWTVDLRYVGQVLTVSRVQGDVTHPTHIEAAAREWCKHKGYKPSTVVITQ